MLPPNSRWSDRTEDGERQSGGVGKARAADERREEEQPVPPRYRLSQLVPDDIASYVFLGFSTSGAYVWSYRQGCDGRSGEDDPWFYFQVWLWRQERPLVLLLSEPFYCADDDEGDGLGGGVEHPDVKLLDSADDRAVVVYACQRPRRGDKYCHYHFTIIPLLTTVLGDSRASVACHRFTCECQYDEFPVIPVSLHTMTPGLSTENAGRYLLLVQTSTDVNCLRFDVVHRSNSAASTTTATHSGASAATQSSSVSDSSSGASSLRDFRHNSHVLGAGSWTDDRQRAPVSVGEAEWCVLVRSEGNLEVEELIAAVSELGSDFRPRDYHLRNLHAVSTHQHSRHHTALHRPFAADSLLCVTASSGCARDAAVCAGRPVQRGRRRHGSAVRVCVRRLRDLYDAQLPTPFTHAHCSVA